MADERGSGLATFIAWNMRSPILRRPPHSGRQPGSALRRGSARVTTNHDSGRAAKDGYASRDILSAISSRRGREPRAGSSSRERVDR